MDVNSLAHTKWECKYHIVFAPKYRRQVIYKNIKADVGQILGTLCRRKGIEIIEAECCPDHIHMLVRIPPKYSVSEIVGYLKGKSSLMIFEKHANLKYKYGNGLENMVLDMMDTTQEPEDYKGENGLLYCGKCHKPKEAYFPQGKALFGRDRHPSECDCRRTERERLEKRN